MRSIFEVARQNYVMFNIIYVAKENQKIRKGIYRWNYTDIRAEYG